MFRILAFVLALLFLSTGAYFFIRYSGDKPLDASLNFGVGMLSAGLLFLLVALCGTRRRGGTSGPPWDSSGAQYVLCLSLVSALGVKWTRRSLDLLYPFGEPRSWHVGLASVHRGHRWEARAERRGHGGFGAGRAVE